MPNRIISEKCRTSPTLAALTSDAERLWWRLMTIVDDYGRFEADARILNGSCVPLLQWTDRRVLTCLEQFAIERPPDDKPLVFYYVAKARVYGQMVSFLDHQRKRDSKPKYPGLKDGTRIMPPLHAASSRETPRDAATCGLSESEIRESRDVSESRSFSVSGKIQRKEGDECPEEVRERFRRIGRKMPA